MTTQSIKTTVFGASLQEFKGDSGEPICLAYLHTYSPADPAESESFKGNCYQRLACDKAVFEKIKLPAHPVELELLCQLKTGSKNALKLHVVDVRSTSGTAKAS